MDVVAASSCSSCALISTDEDVAMTISQRRLQMASHKSSWSLSLAAAPAAAQHDYYLDIWCTLGWERKLSLIKSFSSYIIFFSIFFSFIKVMQLGSSVACHIFCKFTSKSKVPPPLLNEAFNGVKMVWFGLVFSECGTDIR